MSTYRELVYLVKDELKGISDDFTYTEDHLIFLLDKYRTFLLKQKYSDLKKAMPDSNYQEICLDLIEVPAICGEPCEGGSYLRSKNKIPFIINIGNTRVYPIDYYQGEITFISRDRMRYVGHNKYLQNIIYCSIAPDNYLYFKSMNPQFLYLEKVKMAAIFQDSREAFKLKCDNTICDILDEEFPLEDPLIAPLLELVIKNLTGSIYRPEDTTNNSADDLSKVNIENK